jgi:recombination protein RecT
MAKDNSKKENQATTAVATQAAKSPATLEDYLKANNWEKKLKEILPRHIPAHRFIRLAIAVCQKPELRSCSPDSILVGIWDCAKLGLELDVRGSAHLVPFGGKATLVIGYRGLIDLAKRSGEIGKMEARCVYEGDEFQEPEYTPALKFRHKPCITGKQGKMLGAYAVAFFRGANIDPQLEYMSVEAIEAIRNKAASRNSPAWTDAASYPQMCKKTVIRRLCNLLQLTPEVAEAIARDDEAMGYNWTNARDAEASVVEPGRGVAAAKAALSKPEMTDEERAEIERRKAALEVAASKPAREPGDESENEPTPEDEQRFREREGIKSGFEG